MSCAMSVERCNSTRDKRRQCNHHEKTHRFEFSGHDSETTTGNALTAILMGTRLHCGSAATKNVIHE
jgi:hypothetical protein